MRSFQEQFMADIEAIAMSHRLSVITQRDASNVVRLDICKVGFNSILQIDCHFQTAHNVFKFDKPVLTGKSNPQMEIIKRVDETPAMIEALDAYLKSNK